jgi:hypothetical protein
VAVCSFQIIDALPAGSNITVTATSASDITGIALEFSGLAKSAVDRTANTGNTIPTPPGGVGTVGPLPPTSQANEVLVAGYYFNTGLTSIIPGTNGTSNACAETASSTYAASPTIIRDVADGSAVYVLMPMRV